MKCSKCQRPFATAPDGLCADCATSQRKALCPSDAATCSPSSVRAFRVVTDYFDTPDATIIRTTTAARAKHRCWDSAHDAGYPIKWASLKVRRAPEYDAAKLIKDRCYGEDFARSILPENDQGQTRRDLTPKPCDG